MQYSIKRKPLIPGMVKCKTCKNDGLRAFTEMSTFHCFDINDTKYAIRHWCDSGGSDSEWIDAKRYCHGYVGPDFSGELYLTEDLAIDEWNRSNLNLLKPTSWFFKLFEGTIRPLSSYIF